MAVRIKTTTASDWKAGDDLKKKNMEELSARVAPRFFAELARRKKLKDPSPSSLTNDPRDMP